MRNFKHSMIAVTAVAMISSLAAAQAASLKDSNIEREQRLNAAAAEQSITIAQKDVTDAVKGTAEITQESEEVSEAESAEESEAAAKSFCPIGYVLISEGTLSVRETPSDEAAVVDQIEVDTEVQVMENSEGWYKISYSGGKTGYVPGESITQDREQASDAKKSYTNYRIAQVSLAGDSVRVRKEASTDSDIITELSDGTYVYVLWGEDDFIRVCYGSSWEEGYVINTSLEFTGEWEAKETISKNQQEIAEAKAEAERKAEEERQQAQRAEANARANASSSSSSQTESNTSESSAAPASSSKGQAIVDTAMNYLGVPYVWGGTSPSGFDCSGLVQYVCAKNGISVARVAADQRNCGSYVSRDNLQPGDLVFFGRNGISHVGIYIGNGNMIHAPQTGDVVKISSINTEYRIAQYAGAVRVY